MMKPIDVLFLCETNAATSLMAEAIVNHRNGLRFRAFSAGRNPAAAILAETIAVLGARAIPTDSLEPKSWSIFTLPGAPQPDLVIDLATVTWTDGDLPMLSGARTLRWPLRDPALVENRRERRPVAEAVLDALIGRIDDELTRRIAAILPSPTPVLRRAAMTG
jgi:arsenate reductase